MSDAWVFGYGSLVSATSAVATLGEPLELVAPVRLRGWRRRWSTARDNLASEKTFAPAGGGEPFRWCLGLNIEPASEEPGANGALLRLGAAQLERLDARELRYDRVDVGDGIDSPRPGGEPVIAYIAKPAHHRPRPPSGAVILASYLSAIEAAFAELGRAELERYRATTDEPPVDVVEGVLVADRIPPGNPRSW